MRLGLQQARASGPLASIGVDGWAVDYGLLDEDGVLLSDPHSYRSPRTEGWRDVARSIGEPELYRRTGIQLMPINTIFQLAAHDRDELARARELVMLPELVAYELTGEVAGERSNAGTTGLLDIATGRWADDLATAIGVDPQILPTPEAAGRLLGEHDGTPVHLVAAHDTACAFAASPLDGEGRAFVSAGTWFIVGIEREAADTSEQARIANFSNEVGALGGFRYLKNVTGFWLLERCASEWGVTARDLLDLAAEAPEAPVFDVRDERFLAPTRMDEEVRDAADLDPDAPSRSRRAVDRRVGRRRGGRCRRRAAPAVAARGGGRGRRRRSRFAVRARSTRPSYRCPGRSGRDRGDGAGKRPPPGHRGRPLPRSRRGAEVGSRTRRSSRLGGEPPAGPVAAEVLGKWFTPVTVAPALAAAGRKPSPVRRAPDVYAATSATAATTRSVSSSVL